ncbi:TPA: hypothetical protein RYX68_004432, partial [Serratia marcescens]|nr:hypothetical protein [Serratia marcescens]
GKKTDALRAPGADLRRALRRILSNAVQGDQGCGIGFRSKAHKHI